LKTLNGIQNVITEKLHYKLTPELSVVISHDAAINSDSFRKNSVR